MPRGEGLGIPSPHLGCHGGPVTGGPVRAWNAFFISRSLYLAVYCSVSLASKHTYADFWEMIPGIVSAFYLFGSGYTYGVSLRGYGQKFTISTCRWFLEDDFRIVSVFSAQLGSIMDTWTASVYEASFFVFWWSLVSPYSAQCLVRQLLREMTSCKCSYSGCSSSWPTWTRRKERTYPELVGPRRRARLVVLGIEVGGRMSMETTSFLSQLAKARSRQETALMRRRVEQAWRMRWGAILACATARAVATSSLNLCTAHGADGNTPPVHEVEGDHRYAGLVP